MSIDTLSRSWQIAQTGLPDLTQPQYLDRAANQLPIAVAIFTLLAIGIGAGMALVNFSMRNHPQERNVVLGDWMMRSTQLLQVLQQTVLIVILLLMGYFFCSTLASRQANWEQARVAQKTPEIAGELVRQASPQVSYISQEPYTYTTELNGKLVKVQDKKDVTRQGSVSGSNLQVAIGTARENTGDNNYPIDFKGDYQITNPIGTTDRFVFKINPPTGYSLLQNFNVESNGKRLNPVNPGEYSFPLQIAPGSISKVRVSYLAQGSPQWVYSAKDGSLANFRMKIATKVPRLSFTSGITPSKVEGKGDNKVFNWAFDRNASVREPFGVSVSAAPVAVSTGIFPTLLLLAPGILLWWLVLLCFSVPMRLSSIAIAGFVFFAGMFALTYFGRIADPRYVWGGISAGLLLLVWGLGRNNWRASLAAIICTIVGAIAPVYAFLVGSPGMTLAVTGLVSVIWLAARNWYGWYQLEPTATAGIDSSGATLYENPNAAYTRHDLLEESAQYNQLNPAAPSADEGD